ncbi:MAG TPA: DNA polymerase domain-containing protein [Nitrososphaeraceae archaeon]|nr:DNA polymerase domain-containing protein [Nitrososphaeraceae archaeon]
MSSCIGWLFDISIEHDQAVIWIKTADKKILKLRDSYHPAFYILPRNETDGLYLFQILSRQQDIVKKVSWEENKFTNLFDCEYTDKKKRLIYVQVQSIKYYLPLVKKIRDDLPVKQLFNTDLSHIQQYLFTRLRIEPSSKVKVEYDGSKIREITKLDDDKDQEEVSLSPPPFSLLYFDLHTFSGILAPDDGIRLIKVRYEDFGEKKERQEEDILFQNTEEKAILQEFSDYILAKDPDIIICMGDYDNNNTVLRYMFARARKIGFNLQLGREAVDDGNDDDSDIQKSPLTHRIKGRICISSRYRHTTYFDQYGLAGLIERARFGFLPLGMAARYGINRLIDSRNCDELIQRDFVIPNNYGISSNNHEHIRTIEQIVSRDKGGMIISPQIGLHENVVVLDYDSEYANLIVNHNLSYETVTLEGGKGIIVQQQKEQQPNKQKGLLPTIVERFLKRRLYFKMLLKRLPKESMEYVWCDQRVNSLKNILVCLYGSTGSLWNRYGNVLAFEEINKMSRDILIKTKDIVQGFGYELVYADTDSVFIKKKDSTAKDYKQLIDTLSKETGLSISVDYHYKFLVLLPLEADEKIEVLKHYFGITYEDELVVRGIEVRRHDTPNFIKQFQTQLLYTLFDCKDSSEVIGKGYQDALLLVTQAIDKIMIGEGITQQDLVISKLLRQDIEKYKSLFPHVSAAIQLINDTGNRPLKGDTIEYIYANSQHNNPLCRVVPIDNIQEEAKTIPNNNYDKQKYREMILDAAETILGLFGFDRTVYSNIKKKGRRKWYDELREERAKDLQTETME